MIYAVIAIGYLALGIAIGRTSRRVDATEPTEPRVVVARGSQGVELRVIDGGGAA